MRKVFVIAAREYNAAVRTKAFVIGLLLMPLMMGGSLVVQRLLSRFQDTQEKRFVVVDRVAPRRGEPPLSGAVEAAVAAYNRTTEEGGKQVKPRFHVEKVAAPAGEEKAAELRAELSERVRRGELFGFVEIGPDVIRGGAPGDERAQVRYQSNRPTHREFPLLVQQALAAPVQEARAGREGVSAEKAARISQAVPVVSKGLSVRTAEGQVQDASEQSRFAPLAVPMALMMLMFMMVLMSATPLMQGVVEEKMQRIAEVLLGSVQPFQLMLGKLVGMTGVSLTMACVYLGGAYWAAHRFGFAEHVHWSLLAWFFVYQTLASLMYGSLFIAVGAACTDMKETQSLLWPVMLLAVLPMFMMGTVLQEPNSGVVTAASFFPFATPMLMISRQGVPPGVPWWQPPAGTAVVLLTTLLCVWAAGRIFRVGLLLQGKGANLGEMARWVLRG